MFNTVLSNRKRWQKVKDVESAKRRPEELICHDRTHLLEACDGDPGKAGDRKRRWQKVKDLGRGKRQREEPIYSGGNQLPGGIDHDGAAEKLEEIPEEVDSVILPERGDNEELEPSCALQLCRSNNGGTDSQHRLDHQWIADMNEYLAASKLSKEQLLAASSLFAKDVRECYSNVDRHSISTDVACCGGSWRGVKAILRKQFMPSNLKKDALEDLQILNRKERALAGSSEEATTILSSRTNLPECRNMHAKIQNGISKSVLPSSVKNPRLKKHQQPSHKENLDSSTANKVESHPMNCIIAKTEVRKENRRNVQTENPIVRKVNILLSKASDVAWKTCDVLKLE